MNKRLSVFTTIAIVVMMVVGKVESTSSPSASSSSSSSSSSSPISYDGWELLFQDEFNDDSLNTDVWNPISQSFDYNMELEDYTPENIVVENGYLNLVGKKENYQNHNYTSGKITSSQKFNFTYGRVESSMKLPYGQGWWPAFWMLGESIQCWPEMGEIDIMEQVMGDDTIYGTFHYSTQCNNNVQTGGKIPVPSYTEDFNLYSVIWDENEITWMVNNYPYFTMETTSQLPVPSTPFYLIYNLAIGGDWGGNPTASTVFPQNLTVDYVRVYKRTSSSSSSSSLDI